LRARQEHYEDKYADEYGDEGAGDQRISDGNKAELKESGWLRENAAVELRIQKSTCWSHFLLVFEPSPSTSSPVFSKAM
jgi:hypothetical protein